MFKMIFLLVGLAVGFGGGIYFGQKHPDQAQQISAAEEKKFLEYQLALSQKIQAKLDQLQGKASTPKGASGFIGGGPAPAVRASHGNDVRADAQKQQDELQKRLAAMK